MRYFILKQDKEYTDAPNIVNWFGKIDTNNMKPGRYGNLKAIYSLQIRENSSIYHIDMITEPFLAVSEMMEFCIKKYEPNIGYSRLYLLERKSGTVEEYFIPYLTEEDCLASSSIINMNKTVIEKAVIDLKKVNPNKYIFIIGNLNTRYVVAREEFVESILRRGARGIHFIPMETVN